MGKCRQITHKLNKAQRGFNKAQRERYSACELPAGIYLSTKSTKIKLISIIKFCSVEVGPSLINTETRLK